MNKQSFMQVFVTNSTALLASGQTVESLAVGQIGILDGNTKVATTAPTYANNKAIQFVWGTPDIDTGLMGGVPNENEYSKLVKGKLITNFRGKKAARPRNQKIRISDISAECGDQKFLYLKFTGSAIDKLFTKQGHIRQYSVDTTCMCDNGDCAEACQSVSQCAIAEEFVKQINLDSKKFLGGAIKAGVVRDCDPAVAAPTVECEVWTVEQCDNGDDIALGLVQAQYPGEVVTRVDRQGATSTYQIIKTVAGAPADLSNAGNVVIVDCASCPSGYTLVPEANVFQVTFPVNTVPALTGQISYQIINNEGATETALIVVATSETVADVLHQIDTATWSGTFVGLQRDICTLHTPTTTAWTQGTSLWKFEMDYTLTIADDCGAARLAEIQAAYPSLVVSLDTTPGDDCINTYRATVQSECVELGCTEPHTCFTAPVAFDGISWVADETSLAPGPTSEATCACEIEIEVAFVNRTTNECTFDYFPAYEYDTLFVEASEFNPDWNGPHCDTNFTVKEVQTFKHPIGDGAYVRALEKKSKSYDLRERSFHAVTRENHGYSFQANPEIYYDEYVLEYEFKYKVGGWSNSYVDSYHQHFFFPEGFGTSFQTAINGYLSSTGIQIDPVIL